MKLLVTGGLGFIGSNFIRFVFERHPDWEVVNVDKVGVGANPANLRGVEGKYAYSFVKGDIRDFELMRKLVRDVDAVVNMAAETHVDRSISNPSLFLDNNVVGTFTLLEAVRKENPEARVLHVSTDEVYGEIAEGSFSEEDRLKPSSPYAASKAASDMFCFAYHRTYGLDVVVARCTNNFGPYQHPEKLIPKATIRALKGLPIPIYGKGENVRDWLYVEDHCEALLLLLEKGEAGEAYNISAGNERTNLEVVRGILRILGKPEDLIAFVEDRPGHDRRYSLDSSKIRALGWRPKHPFEEALKKTVRWYADNPWWWEPLVDERVLHPTPWKLKW